MTTRRYYVLRTYECPEPKDGETPIDWNPPKVTKLTVWVAKPFCVGNPIPYITTSVGRS